VLVRQLVSPTSSATAVLWTCLVDRSTTLGSGFCFHTVHFCRACYLHQRATERDFASTFDGPVWVYLCDVCGCLFLKEAVGMTTWRAEARRSPPGTPRHPIAHLPVSRYRRGSCGACFSRLRGEAKRAADRPADPVPPPAPVFPPTKRARLRKLFVMALARQKWTSRRPPAIPTSATDHRGARSGARRT